MEARRADMAAPLREVVDTGDRPGDTEEEDMAAHRKAARRADMGAPLREALAASVHHRVASVRRLRMGIL